MDSCTILSSSVLPQNSFNNITIVQQKYPSSFDPSLLLILMSSKLSFLFQTKHCFYLWHCSKLKSRWRTHWHKPQCHMVYMYVRNSTFVLRWSYFSTSTFQNNLLYLTAWPSCPLRLTARLLMKFIMFILSPQRIICEETWPFRPKSSFL